MIYHSRCSRCNCMLQQHVYTCACRLLHAAWQAGCLADSASSWNDAVTSGTTGLSHDCTPSAVSAGCGKVQSLWHCGANAANSTMLS